MQRSPRSGRAIWAWAILTSLAPPASGQVFNTVQAYPSDGKMVPIECYGPSLPGKFPAVILLHGSGGLEQATGDTFRAIAASLADRGYVAFIPHIFEKTNHRPGAGFRDGEYDSWLAAVTHAMDYASKFGNVDGDRFGFIGYSMGANLSTILSTRDARIKALVNCSGAYAPGSPRRKIPPLLILHGSKDSGTPVSFVQKYQERLKELEIPHAVHIYKGSPHNFSVDTFADAAGRAARFFDRYLRAAPARVIEEPPKPTPRAAQPPPLPDPTPGAAITPTPTTAEPTAPAEPTRKTSKPTVLPPPLRRTNP